MKLLIKIIFTLFIFTLFITPTFAQIDLEPPIAKKETKVTKIHGYELKDDYAWLRDRNEKISPEIMKYLNGENLYTQANMKPYKGLVDTLYKEMVGRIEQNKKSVPYKYGKHWYYTKNTEGKQYKAYMRSKTFDGKGAEVLLDENEMAKGYKFFRIAYSIASDDGNLLAYIVDNSGNGNYTLHIKDLRTGNVLPNKIERATYFEWAADNKTIFVSTSQKVTRNMNKVWKHSIAKNKSELIYEEKNPLYSALVSRSADKKMIFLGSYSYTSSELSYIPSNKPNSKFKLILPRKEGHKYSVNHHYGSFYITTNDNAENKRVVKVPVSNPQQKNWKEFIAHNPDVNISSFALLKNYAVVSEYENGLQYIRVIDLKSKKSKRIKTPEKIYMMGLTERTDFDSNKIRYSYESMITPRSIIEIDLRTEKTKVLDEQLVKGYDRSKFKTERVWITARDGVKVPITLMMKKGVKLDGKAPMFLRGYGAYGASNTPRFSFQRLSLAERGMIVATSHVRGGGLLGEKWRQGGRMMNKLNTFYDFIDSAKWLTKNKYTSSDRLVIEGISAGGLLMGGVINMSPNTFKAAILGVPFVDVMNTMLDETIPLTTGEWLEWGNPNEKPAFDYMIQYSPYENIKEQNYPNLLVSISLYDKTVPYWEGAKLVAKIRSLKTNKSTVLLNTNMQGGHQGSSGRYDQFKETAFRYAYALNQVGITK